MTVTARGTGRDAARATPAKKRRWLAEVGWKYPVAALVAFYALFPLVYVVSASLNPRGSLASSNALFSAVDFSNYAALSGTSYWTWVGNTLLVGGVASVGAVLMGAAGPTRSRASASRGGGRASPDC